MFVGDVMAGRLGAISLQEYLSLFASALAIGFVMSFRSWGATSLNVVAGVTHWVFYSLFAFLFLLIRLSAQKFVALKKGYLLSYSAHRFTLPISIFLAFFSFGFIPFLSVGEVRVNPSHRLRLGTLFYSLNYGDLALIGLAAPLSLILFMVVLKPLFLSSFAHDLLVRIVLLAALISVSGLLPIVGQEGLAVLYYRRWLFILSFSFVVIYFVLVLLAGVFSYVVAFLLALLVAHIYKTYAS